MPQDGVAYARTENDGGASHASEDPLRCGYTLTPDDIERDEDDDIDRFEEIFHGGDRDDPTVEGDRWVCHRRIRRSDERCVFHAHDTDDTVECEVNAAEVLFDIVNGETDDRAWNADEERDGLWEVVREDGEYGREEYLRRRWQFVGASLGEVTLAYERLSGPKAYPIDLRCGRAESLDFRRARVEHTLDLRGLHQTDPDGELNTYGTRIDPLLTCQHAVIEGDVVADHTETDGAYFNKADVSGDLSVDDATVEGFVLFNDAEVTGGLSLARAEAKGIIMNGTTVEGEGDRDREYDVRLDSLTTESDIIANGQTDLPDLSLARSEIGNTVSFGADTEDGATVRGDVSLDYATVERSVKFQDAEVRGDLSLNDATVEGGTQFRSAEIRGDVSLYYATVEGVARFRDAEIRGDVSLISATVDGGTFQGAEVQGNLSLNDATLNRQVRFQGADIRGDLSLISATVEEKAEFRDADIKGDLSLGSTTVEGSVRFKNADVTGGLSLALAEVGWQVRMEGTTVEGEGDRDREYDVTLASLTTESDIVADGQTDLPDLSLVNSEIGNNVELHARDTEDGATVRGDVSFDYATVERSVKFQDAEVRGDLSMTRVDVEKRVRLPAKAGGDVVVDRTSAERLDAAGTVGGRLVIERSTVPELNLDCVLEHPAVDAISLAGTTVDEGTLNVPENRQTVYDFEDAVLGDVRIAPERDSHCNHARFLETGFDGFGFSSEREGFRRAGWNVHEPRGNAHRDIAIVRTDVRSELLDDDVTPIKAARVLAAPLVVGLAAAAADEESPATADPTIENAVDAYRRWIESGDVRSDEEPSSRDGSTDGPADETTSVDESHADGGVEGPLFATQSQRETFESRPQQVQDDVEDYGLSGSQTVLDRLRDVDELIDIGDLMITSDATFAEDVVAEVLDRLDKDEATRAVEELEAAIAREIADPDRIRGDDNRIESTYAQAKEGASAVGDETAAGEFFQQEARFSRSLHWSRGTGERGPIPSVLLFVLWAGGALSGFVGLGVATVPALVAATGNPIPTVDATVVVSMLLLLTAVVLVRREVVDAGQFRRLRERVLPWGTGLFGIGVVLADLLGAVGAEVGGTIDLRLLGVSLVVLSLTALGGRTFGDNERLRAYVGNAFLDLTMGYGEKPLRVLGFSAVIVAAFAYSYRVAYAQGIEQFDGVQNFDPSSWFDYLSLSLEMFVSLLINQPTIGNEWVQLAAQVEGFLGVFVAGMFVVAVTRAVHR